MTRSRPVFLERQSYRRRRLSDAARLAPIVGVLFFAIPLLWPAADSAAVRDGLAEPMGTVPAMLYIFAAWTALIIAMAVFGQVAIRIGEEQPEDADR